VRVRVGSLIGVHDTLTMQTITLTQQLVSVLGPRIAG
jgi:hypothetical protein